jgi:endonuclease/exonuclease/phosphatase (EEP) superfamily protein YafD
MLALESDYPYLCKIPLENTYGMHLYSKLPMTTKVHNFVAEDLPSIEAELQTSKGYRFTLFCVHPPPPSPTEEENSKERDGELLAVAKKIRESGRMSTVVVGDFNNVAWSRSSVLFRKLSETIDPRVGRSLTPTFHAKYWFARFPIDQLFHSTDIHIEELKTLPYFGSDHLPLYCKFSIGSDKEHQEEQEELLEELEEGELEEADEMIAEGVEEEGDRDDVAT